jgi:hypothetical protein
MLFYLLIDRFAWNVVAVIDRLDDGLKTARSNSDIIYVNEEVTLMLE